MTVTEPYEDDLLFSGGEEEGPGDSVPVHDGTASLAAVINRPSNAMLDSHHGVDSTEESSSPYASRPSDEDEDEDSSFSEKVENLSLSSSSSRRGSKPTKKKKIPKTPKRSTKKSAGAPSTSSTDNSRPLLSKRKTFKSIDTSKGDSLRRPSDIFKTPVPIANSLIQSLDSCPPVDWSDCFNLPFNLSLDADPNSWSKFCSEFDKVTTSSELQRFLSCDLDSSPQAFLCVDPKGKIRFIHNLLVSPDSGNFLNPVPSFVGLCHSKFGSPPICLDTDDIDSGLLLTIDHSGVPSAAEILAKCSYDALASPSSKNRPDDCAPKFHLDFASFGNLKKPMTPSDPDASVNTFTCKGLFPIHPAFSGELLRLFSRNGHGTPRCGAPSIATCLFGFIFQRWACSTPEDDQKSCTSIPLDSNIVKIALPLFRFLWLAHHHPSKIESVSLEVPANFDSALTTFNNHLRRLFPDFVDSLIPRSLPPFPHAKDPQVPQGVPPPSLAPPVAATPSPPTQPSGSSVSADTIYMVEKLSEQLSESFLKHSKNAAKDKEDEKREIFKHTSHLRNGIVFGQVGPNSSELPQSPSDVASELFRQKSTHTLYSTIHARVFRKSDNACQILFGQCGVLQKFGFRWRENDNPSGFSPFSFDPNGGSGSASQRSLDHDIQHDIYECSLRHDNGLSTKDMRDIFVSEKLFFPLTCDEFAMQLRSFYLFACAIWDENSFACLQLHKMVEHFLSNRFIYRNSQDFDPTFLCRVLFSIDFAIQRFIDKSLEDADCLEDIRGDKLDYHFNKLCDKIESKEDICKMLPKFIDQAIRAKAKDSSGNSGGSSSNSSSKKRSSPTSDNDSRALSARYESPADWCLPSDLKYSKVFTRDVLSRMPTMSVDGKDRPFCNKLFAMKYCRNGNSCHFCHADPKEHGKANEMSAFYKKVYAEAKKKSSS